MNKAARLLIAATFAAYPSEKQFFANEYGQCFKVEADGLTKVTKKENADALTAIEKEEKAEADKAAAAKETETKIEDKE